MFIYISKNIKKAIKFNHKLLSRNLSCKSLWREKRVIYCGNANRKFI